MPFSDLHNIKNLPKPPRLSKRTLINLNLRNGIQQLSAQIIPQRLFETFIINPK